MTGDYRKAISSLEYGETDAVMEIPRDFEKDLMTSGSSPVQISLNAVNDTKGSLGANYISAICAGFSAEYLARTSLAAGGQTVAVLKVSLEVQNRFNRTMDYKHYMIPAFMIIILILLGGFLPALNIVGEKEKGTIEQINITPVPKFTFIFAKLIPYWVMVLLVLTVTMLLAYLVYGLSPLGGVWTIFLFAVFFIFAISGFGLIVSNYSNTMQQAMFVMFFFILVLIRIILIPCH